MNKRGYLLSIIFLVIIALAGCQKDIVENVKVKLNKSVITLDKGQTEQLVATITPESAKVSVKWSSSDKSVATVSPDGDVTGVAAGEAVITVSADKDTAECKVVVRPTPIEEIILDHTSLTMEVGEKVSLKASVVPADADDAAIEWKSLNDKVVVVDESGNIEALAAGKATIVAAAGGKIAQCMITVNPPVVHVESVRITEYAQTLVEGETFVFVAVVSPEDATDKSVIWESSNSEVIVIDQNGKALAVEAGTVEISVKTVDGGKTDKCVVIVDPAAVPVEKVEIDGVQAGEVIILDKGEEKKLTATVYPAEATEKSVIWKSSDSKVLTVSEEGLVTAVAAGSAKVTVTSTDGGKTDECEFKVIVPAEGIEIVSKPDELKMVEGSSFVFSAVVTPEDATDKAVEWKSSDSDILKIDSSTGEAEAIKAGKAKVSATAGAFTAECEITVVSGSIAVESVTITSSPEGDEMTEGDTFKFEAQVNPEDADELSVVWTSSDATVISISKEGSATALKAGKTVISASCGGRTDSRTIMVQPKVIPVESVEITTYPSSLKMNVGETFEFKATVLPDNASDKSLSWISSDPKVISISAGGKAEALTEGTATLTVITGDGDKKDEVTINVSLPVVEVTGVEFTSLPDDNRMLVGGSFTFAAKVIPSDATEQGLVWASSDDTVLSIDETGNAKALSVGSVSVSVTTVDGAKTAKVLINVLDGSDVDVTSVILTSENGLDKVRHGKTLQLIPNYSPSGAYPKETLWRSSNENLAVVDENGLVKAVNFDYSQSHSYYNLNGYPQVVITHMADNITATFNVTILPAMPEKIIVSNPPPATMTINQTWDMGEVTILPEEAEDSWIWIASNENGDWQNSSGNSNLFSPSVFVARSLGCWTIRITANGEFAQADSENTAFGLYTVNVIPIYESFIQMSRTSHTIEAGTRFNLTAELTPSNATFTDIEWTSSDPSVATVKNGSVVGVSAGTANITAKSHHGLTATCRVTVKERTTAVSIGDYYYSDGTISSELISGKTPVGIVFALADAAASDPSQMGADHAGCTHGLAVSLKNYYSALKMNSDTFTWMDVSSWAAENGYMSMASQSAMNGYSNTKAHLQFDDKYGACSVVFASGGVYDSQNASASLPASTSGWYLPSLFEAGLLAENFTLINQKLTNAGAEKILGGNYWISSYFSNTASSAHAYRYDVGRISYYTDNYGDHEQILMMSIDRNVRFIFAF